MGRNLILLGLAGLLVLPGCALPQQSAHGQVAAASPSGMQTKPSLSYDEDPDGDGDTKGANYFPTSRPATGHRVFIFDPNYSAWAMYNEYGERVNTGRASGGKLYCPDVHRACKTVVGRFNVVSKGGPRCISSKYPIETHGGAPMPYCMHFGNKGYAVHGSNDVPDYNASHGCIRITPTVAKWLSQNYVNVGTTVIVVPYKGRK